MMEINEYGSFPVDFLQVLFQKLDHFLSEGWNRILKSSACNSNKVTTAIIKRMIDASVILPVDAGIRHPRIIMISRNAIDWHSNVFKIFLNHVPGLSGVAVFGCISRIDNKRWFGRGNGKGFEGRFSYIRNGAYASIAAKPVPAAGHGKMRRNVTVG